MKCRIDTNDNSQKLTIECNRKKRILIITACKRSLRRLCFYRCLSVHMGGACMVAPGGHAWLSWGVCMVARGVHVFFEGHAWFFRGVHGFFGGCMVFSGGQRRSWFFGGVCMVFWGGMHGFFGWDTVNERVVRILLECIFVYNNRSSSFHLISLDIKGVWLFTL